ncbi:MAG: hypothetical protein FWH10_09350 [Oscillospiraceae bacterium]|nr:hypothetical protein [Oscillospiraceae bacterium]
MANNKNSGLGGLLKSINNATRTVNSVKNTANNVKRTAGSITGNKNAKPSKQQKQGKDAAWDCECGVKNTTKFCGGCGKSAPTELACPKCKWKRPLENSGMKFCGNCGAQLEE